QVAQSDQFGHQSLDELNGGSKTPQAAENDKLSSDMNNEETLKVILENVHRDLCKNKDYNSSLISEATVTEGKLYKALDAATRAEVTSTVKGLLSDRDRLDVFGSEWSRKSWQAQLNDLA